MASTNKVDTSRFGTKGKETRAQLLARMRMLRAMKKAKPSAPKPKPFEPRSYFYEESLHRGLTVGETLQRLLPFAVDVLTPRPKEIEGPK